MACEHPAYWVTGEPMDDGVVIEACEQCGAFRTIDHGEVGPWRTRMWPSSADELPPTNAISPGNFYPDDE